MTTTTKPNTLIFACIIQQSIKNEDLLGLHELEQELKKALAEVKEAKETFAKTILKQSQEAVYQGFKITYKSQERYAFDISRALEKYKGDEVKMKNDLYSKSLTKPVLRITKNK